MVHPHKKCAGGVRWPNRRRQALLHLTVDINFRGNVFSYDAAGHAVGGTSAAGTAMPWDVWSYDPTIHLLIFVHRVEGLRPVVLLVRDIKKLSFVQQCMNPELVWTVPPDCLMVCPSIGCLKETQKAGGASQLPSGHCRRQCLLVRHVSRVRGDLA